MNVKLPFRNEYMYVYIYVVCILSLSFLSDLLRVLDFNEIATRQRKKKRKNIKIYTDIYESKLRSGNGIGITKQKCNYGCVFYIRLCTSRMLISNHIFDILNQLHSCEIEIFY